VVGLAPGDDVAVRVLDEVRGECLYAGYVSRVAADQLDVADLGLVSTLQKREVVRVRVAIPCRGTVVPHTAATATATVTEATATTGQRIDFTMLDVSAYGMRVLAHVELATGSLIRFRFEELDAPFVIDAVVVRGDQSRTGTHYGCRFVGMTVRQTDSLFGYVLRTQGDQRRERLRVF
jgi:c-di-GMP-binding flagellar brake protein YcgR